MTNKQRSETVVHTKEQIKDMAKRAGISVSINNPGARKTKYEFCVHGRALGYCLEAREAYLFLCGWLGHKEAHPCEGCPQFHPEYPDRCNLWWNPHGNCGPAMSGA